MTPEIPAAVRALLSIAEQGDAADQFNIGIMYETGKGLPQDDAEAAKWYRLAADQGHARAQYNLGDSYLEGKGAPQDYAEAVRWFRLAAEQGHVHAQGNLAYMYANDDYGMQDDVAALMWWHIAATLGDENAVEYVSQVASRMTPAQVKKALRLGHKWLEAHPPQ